MAMQAGGFGGVGAGQVPVGYAGAQPIALQYSPQPGLGVPAPHNSYGQAQSALPGAGNMMSVVKYALLGLGGLCILGGVVLLLAVDAVTGVMIAMSGGVMIGVALAVLPRFSGMLGQATKMVDGLAAKERLAQAGTPAQGRLLAVHQTGRLVNYQPEVQALVEVSHPQLGTYQTQTTAVVPQIAIPRAQPGAVIHLRVNPHNPHDVALVF